MDKTLWLTFLGHPVYKTNEVFLDVQKFAADIDCQGHSSLKVIGYLLAFTRNAWLAITPSEFRKCVFSLVENSNSRFRDIAL